MELDWPFDWKASLEFGIPEGKCPDPAENVSGTVLSGVTIAGECVPILAQHQHEKLVVRSPGPKKVVRRACERFFFTDYDARGLLEEMEAHPALKKIKERVGIFAPIGFAHTGFEALAKAILQQQISLNVAIKNACRIVENIGHSARWKGLEFRSFPSPEDVLKATQEKLRACGLSRPKAKYLTGLAEYCAEKDVERVLQESPEDILKLRGIGRWTLQLVRAAYCHDETAVPYADLGVRRAVGEYFYQGRIVSEKECKAFFSGFEHKLGITVYLLHAHRKKIHF